MDFFGFFAVLAVGYLAGLVTGWWRWGRHV